MSGEDTSAVLSLLQLPPEIVEEILFYLEPEDLLSCSLVSVGWRNAVNSDRVWRKVCTNRMPVSCMSSSEDGDYQSSSEEIEEEEEREVRKKRKRTNVRPLCDEWRDFFNWRRNVEKNWQTGQYSERPLFTMKILRKFHKGYFPDIQTVQTDYEYMFTHIRTRNKLIPSCGFGMGLSVLLIYKIPLHPIYDDGISHRLYVSDSESPGRHDLFKLVNNVFVFVLGNLMHVVRKDTGYSCKRTFFFDGDKDSRVIENDPQGDCPVMLGVGRKTRCDHNGKYFVGCHDPSEDYDFHLQTEFHIWDLKTFEKLGKVSLPEESRDMDDVEFSLLRRTVGLKISSGNLRQNRTITCVYDLENMSYCSDVITKDYVREVIFTNNSIIMLMLEGSTRSVSAFDFRGDCLYTVEMLKIVLKGIVPSLYNFAGFNDHTSKNIYLFGNKLVTIRREFSSSCIRVFDLLKKSQVDSFEIPNLGNETVSIQCMMVDLMIINSGTNLVIRNVRLQKNVQEMNYLKCLTPNPLCNKMMAQKYNDELVILNFW